MRTTAAVEALIRRNAASCEEALKPICKCMCQGALHGKAHSEEWIEQMVDNATRYYKKPNGEENE